MKAVHLQLAWLGHWVRTVTTALIGRQMHACERAYNADFHTITSLTSHVLYCKVPKGAWCADSACLPIHRSENSSELAAATYTMHRHLPNETHTTIPRRVLLMIAAVVLFAVDLSQHAAGVRRPGWHLQACLLG